MIRSDVRDGTTIRNPSTANLLIDSIDRPDNQQSANFTINKKNSILNGFFSRMAVSEVVLDWCVDNVSEATDNNIFIVLLGGAEIRVVVPDDSYTIADILNKLVALLNASPQAPSFSIIPPGGAGGYVGSASLACTQPFTIIETNLSMELNLLAGVPGQVFIVNCPVLLPYTYIDFVSNDITYNQALKDTATNNFEQNILYRWYFAWDTPPPNDAYGYPIYQGYQRFIARRILPFPKQIRWEANMPIGQLAFQVYSSQGTVLLPSQTTNGEMEWKMTLLVSED
jgi:hypothetical protein